MSVVREDEDRSSASQERITTIVRLLLARFNLRQMDLAEALAVDSSTMTRIMQGTRAWKITDLEMMASFFAVPASMFFEDPDTLFSTRFHEEPAAYIAANYGQPYPLRDATG